MLTAVMVAMVMWSCSDSNDIVETTSSSSKGNAFIQLQIDLGGTTTRANMDTDAGESTEYNISSVKAVLTDGSIVKQVIDFTLKTQSGSSTLVTDVESVDAGDFYVYVLANYDECDLTSIAEGSSFTADQAISVSEYTGTTCSLATDSKFLMTNDDEVEETTLYEATSSNADMLEDELGSDGSTVETDGETLVNVIKVNVERAVAKITTGVLQDGDDGYDETKFQITDAYGNAQAVTIDSVALATMNSTEYLFKHQLDYDDNSVTTLAYDDMYYAEDPNFTFTDDELEKLEDDENWDSPFYGYLQSDIKKNFKKVGSSTSFYCLENTMATDMQRRGLATSLIFKAQIASPVFTRLYTSDETNSPLNSYESALASTFSAIVSASNGSVESTLFEPETGQTAFYLYRRLLFASEAAARMYKTIVTHQDITSGSELLELYNEDTSTFDKYEDGYMYYTYFVKHNTASTVDSEWGKYGVVRNHVYKVTIAGVSDGDGDDDDTDGDGDDDDDPDPGDFGDPDPEPYTPGDDPDDPDDGDGDDPIDSSKSTKLQVVLTINPWNVISDDSVILTND